MGRLTKRVEDTWGRKCIGIGVYYARKFDWFYEALEKLAHYEDLEEQGRLIEVVRCKKCQHEPYCKISQDLGEDGYCSKAELKYLEENKA